MGNRGAGAGAARGSANMAVGRGLGFPGSVKMPGSGVKPIPNQTSSGQPAQGLFHSGAIQAPQSGVLNMLAQAQPAQAASQSQAGPGTSQSVNVQTSGPGATGYAYSNANGNVMTAGDMPTGTDVPLPPGNDLGQAMPGGMQMLPGGGVQFANGDFMKPDGFQLGGMTYNGQRFSMPGLQMTLGQNPSINMNGQPTMPNMSGLLGLFANSKGQ